MNIPIDPAWLETCLLAAVRITAFIVIAPPFSYNAIPLRIKGMLALGLAVAMAARLPVAETVSDTGPFILALLLEVATGAALGFLVYLVFAAIQTAGAMVDTFGGFAMAQAFDPQSMVNGAQFTRLFQLTALALLLASDGYQLIIGGLARSFDAIPVGAAIDPAHPAQLIATATTGMFLAAVQIAGPLLVVLFLADAGLGLLTRVAPALNAFAMGFPLKIMLTLSLGGLLIMGLGHVVPAMVSTVLGYLARAGARG
ncbi:flagellar biosynthetic protein FliR [Arthrobacter wenxiniae]|jgi:flagellar biosynthetic protein FliR|uniref:Flagellar biosynthetic protein FliR n=1 Tax=Arthrobacter wenxiniae TaxID=2713570 RepID=A0A7Y7LZP9_9MICC|nr:flagellar biosynthetic protein FliR [Arthrobacter wenxiniae]NVM96217.1 flagellar biosynthetic protein FliR [Arthrobacter wenxiniae]